MSKKYKGKIGEYKYVIVLLSLINLILIPIHLLLFPSYSSIIIVTNFTIIILAGLSLCQHLKRHLAYYATGLVTLIAIWLEYSYSNVIQIQLIRLLSSLALFSFLTHILIRQLINDRSFSVQSILGAISGYLFIGLIGGVIFETIHLLNPSSFEGLNPSISYSYYYFSFISITTVGYGDITPITPVSQAITIILNIAGQLYLTVVVAVFVGKFLSNNYKTN